MTIRINSTPEKVFTHMDQSVNLGMHMMESSTMMVGGHLKLIQLSENATGLHSKFKWVGDILRFQIDFIVEVIWWIKDKEKVWETIGNPKMMIMKWFQMHLFLSPEGQSTNVTLTIVYQLPDSFMYKLMGYILAPCYTKWCLKNILRESKEYLETKKY